MRRRDTLFDIDRLREELKEKIALSETPEVFLDLKKAQQISREIASLENKVKGFTKAENTVNDTLDMVLLAEEENDESVIELIDEELSSVEKTVEEMKKDAEEINNS